MTTNESPEPPAKSPAEPPEAEEGLFERFMALVPEIQSELGRLAKRRERIIEAHRKEIARMNEAHKEHLTAFDAQAKRLQKIMAALGGEDRPTRAKPSAKRIQVSNAILLPLLDAVLAQGSDVFTIAGLHARIEASWSEAITRQAFTMFREMEIIGLAKAEAGQTTFRVLDRQIGEQLRAQLVDRQSEPESPTAPNPPTAPAMARFIRAVSDLGTETFTAFEINSLGLASMKEIYAVIRYMRAAGYIESVGKEPSPDNPQRKRERFHVVDNGALNNLLEGVNA